MSVHAKMEPKVGKGLIQAIYKETGVDPKKLRGRHTAAYRA
jgi:hypothetical protein